MTTLAPLTLGELDSSVAALRARLVDASYQSRAQRRTQLRDLHQLLMRATPLSADPPRASLKSAAAVVGEFSSELSDAMSPRPRTVFRLLRAGALQAAWAVLIDNAIGVVDAPQPAAAVTRTSRTALRLPLLTLVEPPKVFAHLPGFRDPRYGAPDDCYDITDAIRLRQRLDEIRVADGVIRLGGWAALDWLVTDPGEQVRLVVSNGDAEVMVEAPRLRRPDLVTGTRDALLQRAWAGWAAEFDFADPRVAVGSWALWLELDHAGVSRRAQLGAAASDLARAATRVQTQTTSRWLRWESGHRPWCIVVADR